MVVISNTGVVLARADEMQHNHPIPPATVNQIVSFTNDMLRDWLQDGKTKNRFKSIQLTSETYTISLSLYPNRSTASRPTKRASASANAAKPD